MAVSLGRGGSVGGQCLPRRACLRTRADFSGSFPWRFGRREKDPFFCRVRGGKRGFSRVGVVASKRVGKAVARARCKRLLRELFRRHRGELVGCFDFVLVARVGLLKTPFKVLERDFQSLLGVLKNRGGVSNR